MPVTLSDGYALLAFLYTGIVLGMAYDACRFVRLTAKRKAFRTLSDVAFTVAFLCIFGFAQYTVTGFRLRAYPYLVAALGAALQQFAFGAGICKRIVKRRGKLSPFHR